MADQAPKKAKLGLGHWVALGGLALCVAILVWQWIWALTATRGAGAVINAIVQFVLLLALVLATAVVLLMTLKNPRLTVLVYVMAGAAMVLHYFSALSGGGMLAVLALAAEKAHRGMLGFYFIFGLIALVVGNRAASGALALPTSKDVRGVTEELQGKEEAPESAGQGQTPEE